MRYFILTTEKLALCWYRKEKIDVDKLAGTEKVESSLFSIATNYLDQQLACCNGFSAEHPATTYLEA